MFMDQVLNLMVIVGLIGAIVYLRLQRKNKQESQFQQFYNEVLTSDKYKVKGKYEE
ncbi:MAG: hypothetical protein R6V53_03215 [Candidatus Woesearchaeota archaeon]